MGIEPVELHRQSNSAPQEIHLVALQPHIALGLLDAIAVLEAQEPVLQGRARSVQLSLGRRGQQLPRSPAWVRFADGNDGGVVVEVSVLRLRHRPSQRLEVYYVREVQERPGNGRDRNPVFG